MREFLPSATLSVLSLARKKQQQGERVYNFAAGDPVLKNHPSITKRAVEETRKGICPYPPVQGFEELRRLAIHWINQTCRTNYALENVIVTAGGKFALFEALFCLLDPEDEVIVPCPYWVSYPDLVAMAGGRAKIAASMPEQGWKLTPQQIFQAKTDKSRVLLFNNACNPTGILYTREEVAEILDAAAMLDLWVVSDEVYSGMAFEQEFVSCGSFSKNQDRVIVVQSLSKNFAMTGWRVGFTLAAAGLIRRMAAFQGQSLTGVPCASQWAAMGALEDADAVQSYVKKAMVQRRDCFVQTFNRLFSKPMASPPSALYAFLSLEHLGIQHKIGTKEFCEKLIEKEQLAIVPGEAFGVPGYVRLAYSDEENEIRAGLEALSQAVKRWDE